MRDDYTLLVGTVQASIWRSDDGGDSWTRSKGERPKLPWSELQCFDLAIHPKDPQVVYAGTNDGVYRSDDRGASFERLDSALNDYDGVVAGHRSCQPGQHLCWVPAWGDLPHQGRRCSLGALCSRVRRVLRQRERAPGADDGGGSLGPAQDLGRGRGGWRASQH